MSAARGLAAPVSLHGRLELGTDAGTITLIAEGDRVILDAQSVGAVKALIELARAHLPPAGQSPARQPPKPSEITEQIRQVLATLDLTVELRLAGAAVARVGAAARPSRLTGILGRLSRHLDLGPVEIVSYAAVGRVVGQLWG